MNAVSNKQLLKEELKQNTRRVYWHARFTLKLLARYFKSSIQRNPDAVKKEYEEGWSNYFKTREYFEVGDYPYLENDKRLAPNISHFQYQVEVTDRLIAEYLELCNAQSVLEIGSGGGLNLINLAPKFPHVQFYGLELTESGVKTSQELFDKPLPQFKSAYEQGSVNNVEIIHGSILDEKVIKQLKSLTFDFVYTSAVLEQLHNYLDIVFTNICKLDFKYFLFNEEWLEFNDDINRYRELLHHDYFRAPISFLNDFPLKVIETRFPAKQPMGMNYAMVFGKRLKDDGQIQHDI